MMGRNHSLGSRYLWMNLTHDILMQTLKLLLKDTLDMTQHSRGGYGKGRMTRSLELCVYGIREI